MKKVICNASAAKPLGKDPQVGLRSHRHYEDENGSGDHTVDIRKGIDGHLSVSEPHSDGGFVYLYPEQVRHLRQVLRMKIQGGKTDGKEKNTRGRCR